MSTEDKDVITIRCQVCGDIIQFIKPVSEEVKERLELARVGKPDEYFVCEWCM